MSSTAAGRGTATRRSEVRRGDVVLSCLEAGSGDDVVVLLHGLAGSAREMLPTAEELLPGRRVVAVDQRGHGLSTRRPADLSRRAYVEDVAAVVDQLAGRPVTLVGQSMGGHTGMLTAAWHPRLVRRLVMLEAGVGGRDPGDDYPARLGRFFASWPSFATREEAAAFLGDTPIGRAWLADLDDELRPRFDADVMQAAITAVADEARWDAWQRIEAPVLFVRGERGTVPEAEAQRMIALRPDLTHVVVPDAGHDVHLEQPAAWFEVLGAYLSRP